MEAKANYPEQIISAGQLLRILDTDAREVSTLCQKANLKPKKDGFGNIYFSKGDVDILRKVKELFEQTTENTKVKKVQKKPDSKEPYRFDFEHFVDKPQRRVETSIASIGLNSGQNAVLRKIESIETNVVTKITNVLSEKLDGLDEVIVELIKAKTENENLRQKVNELNKENFVLKSENASFKPVGFGLYVKKSSDNFTF